MLKEKQLIVVTIVINRCFRLFLDGKLRKKKEEGERELRFEILASSLRN